jgi:hypothetical protein
MNITFKKGNSHTGKIAQNRKEKHFYKEICLFRPDSYNYEAKAILTARLYATDTTVYACIWINSPNNGGIYVSGGGKAQGYGYHKESAAIESALMDAGITGFKSFGGAGEQAAIDCLLEIASQHLLMAGESVFYHKAHG